MTYSMLYSSHTKHRAEKVSQNADLQRYPVSVFTDNSLNLGTYLISYLQIIRRIGGASLSSPGCRIYVDP